jgi:TetR/AcrR family transcriptional repressor of nem operon
MSSADTREKIMSAARATVQARGYNALSFRDLATEVGIKSASVHYHFPTKGDLGAALARRYTEDGATYLAGLDASYKDQRSSMKHYTDIFRAALVNDNRMCLWGIMAAEHEDMPPEVRDELNRFKALNVAWLEKLISIDLIDARDRKLARRRALGIFAAIEGAQLIARSQNDIAIYDQVIESYRLAGLIP